MGASTERLALQVTSSADVSGLDRARAGVEGLRKTEEALGAQTQKLTVDAATMNRLLQEYGGDLQKAAQEAARLAQVQTQVAQTIAPTTREIQKQTVALEQQATVLRQETTQALTALEKRIGSSSVAVVFGMESMVRGFAAGESGIRAALRSVGVLAATTLGPAGIAITALVAFGDAAVEHLTRARRELEATRKKFEAEIAAMVNAGNNIGLQERIRDIEVGKAAAGVGLGGGFKGSLRDLTARYNQAVEDFNTADRTFNLKLLNNAKRNIAELRPQLDSLTKERDTLRALIFNPPIAEGANANRPITGIAAARITAGGGISPLRQLALDLEAYQAEMARVMETAGKLKDFQIGMIGQDQLTPLQLLTAEEGRLRDALTATNLSYSERKRLVDELARVRSDEAEARKVINVDPKVVEKQAKEAMDAYKHSRQAGIDEDVAEEEKKRQASHKRIAAESVSAAMAGIRANESLAKVAVRAALTPLETYLEGLAIKEGAKAIEHGADLDFVGAAAHAAAAAAALTAAHEVASLGGFGGGGGGGGRGAGAGTFTPNGGGGGGDVNVTIQTVDPTSGSVIQETIWHINRSELLKRPVVPPSQRRGA